MKTIGLAACAAVVACVGVLEAAATPFRLDYTITDLGGGIYDYNFFLVLDNNDGSWVPGQSFRWFVFGDAPSGQMTTLTNFVGDVGDLPIGPYIGYGFTSGGHNGPDLQSVVTDYIPNAIGDTLHWSGTSTAIVGQGDLLWSNVIGGSSNPGVTANFEVAFLIPTPAALPLLGFAAFAAGARRRRS